MYKKIVSRHLFYHLFSKKGGINIINLTGQRFGKLLATSLNHYKNGFYYWECKCDCGKTKVIRTDSLVKGSTRSCGCLASETATKLFTKHNQAGTRLYMIWNSMKQRCENEKDTGYKNYGGRGISVCKEWEEFSPFFEWAIAHGYEDKLTIDRKDNDGNYNPTNCRWISVRDQNRNKRNNHLITYKNKTMCIRDWENELGFSRNLIQGRLNRGWSIEKALTKSVQIQHRKKDYYGT